MSNFINDDHRYDFYMNISDSREICSRSPGLLINPVDETKKMDMALRLYDPSNEEISNDFFIGENSLKASLERVFND